MSDESKHAKSADVSNADDAITASPPSRYPRAAYEFVSEGLAYSVRKIHGPENAAHHLLGAFMARNNLDLRDLAALFEEGKLPPPVVEAVKQIGGPDKLNRHIGGRDLAWGLREYALTRWGMLARSVLERWNIRGTVDFGQIVFETIEQGRMQKQPSDTLDDFKDVFDFVEAFDAVFRVSADAPARADGSPDATGFADDNPDASGFLDDNRDAPDSDDKDLRASVTDPLDEYNDHEDDDDDYDDDFNAQDDDDPPNASKN